MTNAKQVNALQQPYEIYIIVPISKMRKKSAESYLSKVTHASLIQVINKVLKIDSFLPLYS